ncbi:MAG TPA: histidinol dehydrogenase [Armatimonadota bacterium]|nr:histidinol dehydrogenase [Armatimonadota bacterium]
MRVLDTRTTEPEELARFLDKPLLQDNPEVEAAVRRIISEVRSRGDEAVLEFVRRFDWPQADSLIVPNSEIEEAYSKVPEKLIQAIKLAKAHIEAFHKKQQRSSWMDKDDRGVTLGQMILPVNKAAVVAPAFQAPLPSSLLMGAVTARVAGVREVYVCTPPRKDGSIHPAMAVAAAEAGVDKVYRIGGAHGVAAFAFGTETVPRVDKIVGPGGIYVTMAKRLVYGEVGIDMLAGATEILILADESANPIYVAADLLSQAEHVNARALLVTTSRELAESVSKEVDRQLSTLSTRDLASKSIEANGAIILIQDLDEGLEIANRVAPEHLELAVAQPMEILASVRNAGAILVGESSPEPIGDYVAGPNHILPTSGTARFSSPLNVDDFLKKTNVIIYSEQGLREDGPSAIELAEAEGLDAHANAVRVRLE